MQLIFSLRCLNIRFKRRSKITADTSVFDQITRVTIADGHSPQSFASLSSPQDSGIIQIAGSQLELPVLSQRIKTLSHGLAALQNKYVAEQFRSTPAENLPELIKSYCALPADAAPENVMWFNRFAADIADRFELLNKEFNKLNLDPVAILSDIFTKEHKKLGENTGRTFEQVEVKLLHVPQIELQPTSIIVTPHALDYDLVSDSLEFTETGTISYGATLFYSTLPEPLRGRLIMVNPGDGGAEVVERDDIWNTKRHEELHCHFNLIRELQGRELYVSFRDEFSKISDPHDYNSHQKFVTRAMRYIYDLARSELVAYFSSYTMQELDDYSVFANNFTYLSQELEKYIEKHGLAADEADTVRDIYKVEGAKFKADFIDYKTIALGLYLNCYDKGSVGERNQIDAALMLIPVEEVGTLRAYIDQQGPAKPLAFAV